MIERGLSEEAADRITSLAERSLAEEREYVNGEFARRDREAEGRGSRLDRIEDLLRQISEREARSAERLAKLEEELVQVRLEQERFRSELGRVEYEASAERKRIEEGAAKDRESLANQLRADFHRELLIVTGIVVGAVMGTVAVAAGVIIAVLS